MKEITLYKCELCNTQYASKKMAEECEKAHKKVNKVIAIKYRPYTSSKDGFPDWLTVEFDNGHSTRYIRG